MTPAALAQTILVNDEPQPLPEPATLEALLGALGLAGRRGIAAAVNGEVVPRSGWGGRALNGRDRVVVIRPAQGG